MQHVAVLPMETSLRRTRDDSSISRDRDCGSGSDDELDDELSGARTCVDRSGKVRRIRGTGI